MKKAQQVKILFKRVFFTMVAAANGIKKLEDQCDSSMVFLPHHGFYPIITQ